MNNRTMEVEGRDTCTCGTNEDLVVTGISPIYTDEDGKLLWVVECWNESHGKNKPTYYIDNAARDELFGEGWRTKDES